MKPESSTNTRNARRRFQAFRYDVTSSIAFTSAMLAGHTQHLSGMSSRVTAKPITGRATAGCGSSSSLPAAQAGDDVISVFVTVGAIARHRTIVVIAVGLEVGGGGVGEAQVDSQVE